MVKMLADRNLALWLATHLDLNSQLELGVLLALCKSRCMNQEALSH